MRRRSIALLLAVAAVAAGCGGSDNKPPDAPPSTESGDEGKARQALTEYAQAVADNDPAAACDHMTQSAQDAAEAEVPDASSCEDAHRTILTALGSNREGLADQLSGVDFDVKIEGERAELTSEKSSEPLRMRREGGDWKLDQNTLTYNRNE